MNRFNLKALALAIGISWGVGLMLLGWISATGWGLEAVDILASFYIGYEPTFLGGFIGGIWGFVDGAISGIILGWLYNYFAKKGKKK